KDFFLSDIDDSKKLTQSNRVALCNKLLLHCGVHVGIGLVSPQIIDKINILQATKVAMAEAVLNLPVCPDHLLIDGLLLDSVSISQTKIIKGDSLSLSIASASIIAKVVRDTIMEEYDASEQKYGFARHKGYGTREHLNALRKFGSSTIHRKSFSPVREMCAGGAI
ncbi:ribonuclease HII, partial [bacterium]|nr:ribonuclease HII [bacterium]